MKDQKQTLRKIVSFLNKTERTGAAQCRFFAEEERDDLPLVNLLREDVRRWREADYHGASNVTKDLLRHWADNKRTCRLFYCQREGVQTISGATASNYDYPMWSLHRSALDDIAGRVNPDSRKLLST